MWQSLHLPVLSIACLSAISGYNLNTEWPVDFTDPRPGQGYFGYAVAMYANPLDPLVIVGAPKANISRLPDVVEPGAVYGCWLNGTCREWVLDYSSNNAKLRNVRYTNQSLDGAMIGATIAVENKTEPRVIVCAPKWQNYLDKQQLMNGICFYTVANSSQAFRKQAEQIIATMSDPKQQVMSNGWYRYKLAGMGFSVHQFSDEPIWDVMLGTPGVDWLKGTPVLVAEVQPGTLTSIVPNTYWQQGLYIGYSVTSGFYIGKPGRWYAASAPQTRYLRGAVLVFRYGENSRLNNLRKVVGTQSGEYFGAAMTSCDVDNDGRDELIVGAPLWSRDGDEGRIYVISARKNSNSFDMATIDGGAEDGRFGSSVVCLGDLDHDGYGDVAVGAPYEKESGVVYIFNGSPYGLSSVPSQRIVGRDVGGFGGFGAAISEPRDIDGNGYADIVVGAYKSSSAVLLRAQPVIELHIQLEYIASARLNSNTTSFSVNVCGTYDGYRAPPVLRVYKNFKIDELHRRARLGSVPMTNGVYRIVDILHHRKNLCNHIPIILQKGSKTDPIEISASLSLIDDEESTGFCEKCPVINRARSNAEEKVHLPFDIDCGSDNICHSNLTFRVFANLTKDNGYIVGDTRAVSVTIDVKNYGELAYQAEVHVLMPEYIGLVSGRSDCHENPMNRSVEVVCEIGDPLRDENTLTLELDMSQVTTEFELYRDFIKLPISVSTISRNVNSKSQRQVLLINLRSDASVNVTGKAEETSYSYFREIDEQRLDVIRFHHIYEVQKFGVTPIQQTALTILVPTHLTHKKRGRIEIARVNSTLLKFTDASSVSGVCRDEVILEAEKRTLEARAGNVRRSLKASLNKRVFLLHCEDSAVDCVNVTCTLDVPATSVNSSKIAEVKLTIDLQLKNFTDDLMNSRDIIYFISNGTAAITQPPGVSRTVQTATVTVGTKFLGTPAAKTVAAWIIAVSVVLGILLLALLVFALVKLGFFNRKQKERLEALKAESDMKQGIVIETSSSREVLDQE